MKILSSDPGRFLRPLLLALALPIALAALADGEFIDPYDDYDESAALDMELEENLATPVVQMAEHQAVANYMKAVARKLGQRYKVELLRKGEVAVVTIPSDDLFLPNDTLLSPYAPDRLRPMLPLFRDPDMFKLVYAVHTDDTGSEDYIDMLAAARNRSIYAWLTEDAKVNPELFIINYDMGETRPLKPNTTRANRALNRRVEIFIVPGPKLIHYAHDRKIK